MHRLPRLYLLALIAVAAPLAAAQGLDGVAALALYPAPLFAIAALLLLGRYLGEERIVRRWRGDRPTPRLRQLLGRWREPAQPLPQSVLDCSSRLERGPPALALA